MSLHLISQIDQAFDYTTQAAPWEGFDRNPSIPYPYVEGNADVMAFYYYPATDAYYMVSMNRTKAYPGWSAKRYIFTADGALSSSIDFSFWNAHYTDNVVPGEDGNVYVTRNDQLFVYSANGETLGLTGWVTNDWRTSHPELWKQHSFAYLVPSSHVMVGSGGGTIDVYDYTTPSLLRSIPCISVVSSMAGESKDCLWLSHQNSLLAKVNFTVGRYECVTSINYRDITNVREVHIAFDSKRKRIAVFLERTDDVTGACRHLIQFYNLIPQPGILTDPVPLQELKAGEYTSMDVSLLGEAGEPVSGRQITLSLEEPSTGHLGTSLITTAANGQATFGYTPASMGGTDTITATVESEE